MSVRILVLMAGVLVLTSCSSTDSDQVVRTDQPTALAFAAPTDEVVLTVVGAPASPNVGDQIELDLATIEALGTETTTVFEPFVSQSIEFTAVPAESLLGALGFDPDTPLSWIALDDYEVSLTLGELAAEGALVATRQDGEPIATANGGPLRLVFPDDSGPIGRDSNQWIWSLVLLRAG